MTESPKPPAPLGLPAALALLVLLGGLLAAVWLTGWSLASQVVLSTPLVALAVGMIAQQVILFRKHGSA